MQWSTPPARLMGVALALGLWGLPAKAQETRWVSDQIFIVLHTGPGTNYRWAATIAAMGAATTAVAVGAGHGGLVPVFHLLPGIVIDVGVLLVPVFLLLAWQVLQRPCSRQQAWWCQAMQDRQACLVSAGRTSSRQKGQRGWVSRWRARTPWPSFGIF